MTSSVRLVALCISSIAAVLSSALAQTPATGGSCAAAIQSVLDDIAARDLSTSEGPPRNAFIALNPAAVAEAQRLDREAASGAPKGSLHCLPIAVKDNFDTADLPTTVGSLALVGNRPPRDAAIVARLRKAGAVIVGKTNMDEFGMGLRGLSGSGGRGGNADARSAREGCSPSGAGV